MDLNDELTPREHSDLRDRVTGGVGRMRAARARRSRIVAGAAAVALVGVVVSGVAFAALRPDGRTAHPVETTTVAPTPSPTRTPSPTPDPVPTGTPSPVIVPAAAFGNDCASILSPAELSEVVGATMSEPGQGYVTQLRAIGAIDCRWGSDSGVSLLVAAVPVEAVPADIRERYDALVCERYLYDGYGCRTAVENSHTWALVTVGALTEDLMGVDEATAVSRLESVVPLVGDALDRAPVPIPATRTEQWWPSTACDSLAETLPFGEILGDSDPDGGYPVDSGSDVPLEIARRAGAGLECAWYSYSEGSEPGRGMIIRVHPGTAWDWDRIVSERSSGWAVDVPGATQAFQSVGGNMPDSSYLVATDGVNVIEVMEAPDPVRATELALAALNGAP